MLNAKHVRKINYNKKKQNKKPAKHKQERFFLLRCIVSNGNYKKDVL